MWPIFLRSITSSSLDKIASVRSISDNLVQASDGLFSGSFILIPLLSEISYLLLPTKLIAHT